MPAKGFARKKGFPAKGFARKRVFLQKNFARKKAAGEKRRRPFLLSKLQSLGKVPSYFASRSMISLLRATNPAISSGLKGACWSLARSYSCRQMVLAFSDS